MGEDTPALTIRNARYTVEYLDLRDKPRGPHLKGGEHSCIAAVGFVGVTQGRSEEVIFEPRSHWFRGPRKRKSTNRVWGKWWTVVPMVPCLWRSETTGCYEFSETSIEPIVAKDWW